MTQERIPAPPEAPEPEQSAPQTTRFACAITEADGIQQVNAVGNAPFNFSLDAVDPGLVLADHIRADYRRQNTFQRAALTSFDQQVFYLMLFDLRQVERVAGGVRLFVTCDMHQVAIMAAASKSGVNNAVRRLLNSGFISQTWLTGRDRYFEIVNRTRSVLIKKETLQDKDLTGHVVADRSANSATAMRAAADQDGGMGEKGGRGDSGKAEEIELLQDQGLKFPQAFDLAKHPLCTLAKITDGIGRADQREAEAKLKGQKPFKKSRQAFLSWFIKCEDALPPLREHEKRAAGEQQSRRDEASVLRAQQRRDQATAAEQSKKATIDACRQPATLLDRISVSKAQPEPTPSLENFAKEMMEVLKNASAQSDQSQVKP